MKIAFQVMGNDLWYGGITHLKSFLYALRYFYKDKVTLCLLAPNSKSRVPEVLCKEVDEIINLPAIQKWTIPWVLDRAIKYISIKSMREEQILKQHKVDVVFGQLIRAKYREIPTLSFMPDFQHIHLPEMFSLQEGHQRDQVFFQTAKLSTQVILTSEAVKKDFQAFTPKYAHKARVLKTTSYIPESIYESDSKSILQFYHLPERFIYLPNQFWKHKNHEIVFKALKLLKDKGLEVFVVCSGYPGDYRHPTYFASLFQKLSEWGMRDQVIYLGMITYEHVLLLMRQSICVLNPSLFEGLGLTTNEARSIGKQALLSDLPVFREQELRKATFFDPYDCEDLARKLSKVWCETLPGPDAELESEAQQSQAKRLRVCAETFMSVACEVIGGK